MSQVAFQAMQNQPQPTFPNRDPFYVVKERVQELTQRLHLEMGRWDSLFNSNTTNPEFAQTTKNIRQLLKQINAYVADLQRTIDIVEKNRSRFASISDQELESRKAFVATVKKDTAKVDQTLSSPATQAKIESDQRGALMEDRKRSTGLEREFRNEATSFIDSKMQAQRDMELKQDDILEDMSSILGRLEGVAGEMKQELVEQAEVLDEIHTEVDTAQGSMGVALNKLEKLLSASDKGRWCCIGLLTLSALILFIAIIY